MDCFTDCLMKEKWASIIFNYIYTFFFELRTKQQKTVKPTYLCPLGARKLAEGKGHETQTTYLYHSNHQSTSTPSSMTVNVSFVLWDGWQSLVILRNVKVSPMMIFLQLFRTPIHKEPPHGTYAEVECYINKCLTEIRNLKFVPSKKIQPHTWRIRCSDQPTKERWHCHKSSWQRWRSCCVGQETINRRSL